MWTSVSERLPEPAVDVLVWTGTVHVIARLVSHNGETCWESDDDVVELLPPTHWQPLPAPPPA